MTLIIAGCMIFALTGCDSDGSDSNSVNLSGKHLGWIMYSDGTYTQAYDSTKTAVGIITDCDDDTGKPEQLLMVTASAPKAWGIMGAEYHPVSTGDDGDENLYRVLSSGLDLGYFPIFEDVYAFPAFTSGGNWKSWYIPSYEEMVEDIYRNRTQIEAAVALLGVDSNINLNQDFWTSSADSTDSGKARLYNPSANTGSLSGKGQPYPVLRMTELID